MTAPNIANSLNIDGESSVSSVLQLTPKVILFNEAGSGKLIKVNQIVATNVDRLYPALVTVQISRNGITYSIFSTVSVPANSSVSLMTKEIGIYLEESDAIVSFASIANDIQITASYEVISETTDIVTTRGLQLYYEPGDGNSYPGTGTVLNDLSPNAYNGTLTDVTYLSSNGGVLDFDVTATAICDTQADILDVGANDFTWEVWVNIDAHTVNNQTIFEKEGASSNRSYGLYIDAFGAVNRPTFRYSFDGTNWLYHGLWSNSEPMVTGTWYHVAVVRSGASLTGYRNGVAKFTRSDLSTTALFDSPEFLQFGSTNNSFAWLDGKLGGIRFYNRALSATELLQNFNAHKTRYGL
jgi:hypothetical protein